MSGSFGKRLLHILPVFLRHPVERGPLAHRVDLRGGRVGWLDRVERGVGVGRPGPVLVRLVDLGDQSERARVGRIELRGLVRVAQDFRLLAAAVNLARFTSLGVRSTSTGWQLQPA